MASETMPRIFIGPFGLEFVKSPAFSLQNKYSDFPVHMAHWHLAESLWDFMGPHKSCCILSTL